MHHEQRKSKNFMVTRARARAMKSIAILHEDLSTEFSLIGLRDVKHCISQASELEPESPTDRILLEMMVEVAARWVAEKAQSYQGKSKKSFEQLFAQVEELVQRARKVWK